MLRHAAILAFAASALVVAASPAAADFHLERRLALSPGGTFTLDSDLGSVSVTGDSSSGVVVTVTASDDKLADRLDIQFSASGNSATVTARRRDASAFHLFGDGFRGRVEFVVHVPRATRIDVRTGGGSIHAVALAGPAQVHTSGGSLVVEDIDKDVDATTSGGSIRAQHVRGRVTMHTSGGSIDADDVRGDMDASTSGGTIQVREAGGRVDAHTSGGSVNVAFARGNNRGGDLSTSGGGVRAEIDPKVALSIDAGTSGGGVTADVPVTVHGSISGHALQGDLNGGGATLRLHSSGGGVHITAAPPSSASR